MLVTCTNGEFGDAPGKIKPDQEGHDPDDVARIRLGELKVATEALGVSHVETLGYRDSGMKGWPQNEDPRAFHAQPDDVVAARLIELFERFRPQVVVTYFGNSGYNHPDHLKAHDVTRLAVDAQRHPEQAVSDRAPAFVPGADARDRRGVRRRDAGAAARPHATRGRVHPPDATAAVRGRRRR